MNPVLERITDYALKIFGHTAWKKREIYRQANQLDIVSMILKQQPDAVKAIELGKKVEPPQVGATLKEYEQFYGIGTYIYVGINVIAENIAMVEWKLKDLRSGEIFPIFEASTPFPVRPNPFCSWNELRQTLMIHLETTGNGYLYRKRASEFNDLTEDQYWELRPSRTRVIVDEANNEILGYAFRKSGFDEDTISVRSYGKGYFADLPMPAYELTAIYRTQKTFDNHMIKVFEYMSNGHTPEEKLTFQDREEWIALPVEDVIHIKYPHGANDYYGMSPLQPFILSFTAEMFAKKWNRDFFQNGAIPPGILTLPAKLHKDEMKRLSEAFKENHNNAEFPWIPFIAQGGATYTPIANQHTDLDFLNLLTMSRDEILSILGVPPHMANVHIAQHSSTTSVGTRDQENRFWRSTAIPKMKLIEDAINHKLSNADGFGEGIELFHDLTTIDALQPEWAKLVEAGSKAIGAGMTIQEVRQKIYRLDPDPDGIIYLPSNLVPVDVNNPISVEEFFRYMLTPQLPQAREAITVRSASSRQRQLRREHARQSDDDEESDTDSDIAAWNTVNKEFEIVEDELFSWLKGLFRAQQARVLDWVEDQFEKFNSNDASIDASLELISKKIGDLLEGLPALSQAERQEFIDAALDEFEIQVEEAGEFALEEARILIAFDVLDPQVVNFIQEKAIIFADDVTNTTIDLLRSQFTEAIEGGESIPEIAKRVRSVFRNTIRGTAPRSRLIARTESTGMVNGGRNLAYNQNDDIIDQKEWLSSKDNRVRPSHVAANGQRVDVDKPFNVGGSLLKFPGDPQGPIQEIANCRCTVLPIIVETATDLAPPFPKEGFNTTVKIQSWAEDKYPDINWDFANANKDTMNRTIRQLDKLLEEFPDTREKLQYVGTYLTPSKVPSTLAGEFASVDTIAHISSSFGASEQLIALNPKYYAVKEADFIKVNKRLRSPEFDDKFSFLHSVKKGEDIEAMITHEFGHLVDFGLQADNRTYTSRIDFEGNGSINKLHRDFSKTHRAKATLSRYATSDPKDTSFPLESFAEGFSASYHQRSNKQTAYTKRIKKYRKILTTEIFNSNPQAPFVAPFIFGPEDALFEEFTAIINSIYDRLDLDRP